MQRTITAFLTLSLVLLLPAPTLADEPAAPVTVVIEAPESLVWDYQAFAWQDTVAYSDGLTALHLLAEVTERHGSTYAVSWYDLDGDDTVDDAFVDQINDVHGDFSLVLVGTYWALYQNDVSTSTGAAKTVAQPGDTIRFTFEGFPLST